MTRKVDRNGLQESLVDSPLPPVTSSPGVIASKALPWKERQWSRPLLPSLTGTLSYSSFACLCVLDLHLPPYHHADQTVFHRAIIENASGRVSLRNSLSSSFQSLITRPHIFLTSRPFILIYCLYFGTYATANTVDTLSSTVHNKNPSTTTAGPQKFLATTSVNMSLCLYKDSQYTRLFGHRMSPSTFPKRPVPLASYALFALRDSMTVFASFNLPPLIAPLLPLSQGVEKQISRASAAQFLAPAGIQLFSTPLHLWGLDLYNRPGMRWNQRLARVSRDWIGTSVARMARVVPAFGVGGVVNGRLRKKLMSRCEGS